ncbi:MAG: FmdB family zinc ribbon protein [Polyangiaceae bacterium]
MPTYEYACDACGHEWEEMQRITAPPIEVCPKCSAPSAHRLISGGTNFILKGGGWYSDLYASPKAPAKKATDGDAAPSTTGDAASKPSGEAAGKSESTPASTTPATAQPASSSSTPSSKPRTSAPTAKPAAGS